MGKHRDQLVIDLDKFAADLIKQAKADNPELPVSIDQKGQIFEKVCRWVMVKYKIEPEEQDGAGLAELKRRTKGGEADQPDPNRTHAGRVTNFQRRPTGSGLAAVKRSLPATDDGGALSARADALREVSVAARPGRSVHPGVSGDDRSDAAETDSERSV